MTLTTYKTGGIALSGGSWVETGVQWGAFSGIGWTGTYSYDPELDLRSYKILWHFVPPAGLYGAGKLRTTINVTSIGGATWSIQQYAPPLYSPWDDGASTALSDLNPFPLPLSITRTGVHTFTDLTSCSLVDGYIGFKEVASTRDPGGPPPPDTLSFSIVMLEWLPDVGGDPIIVYTPPADSVDCSLFPNEGILDNFNRANEGPPPTGWSNRVNDSNTSSNDYPGLAVYGNCLRTEGASGGGHSYGLAVWNVPFAGPDVEVYYTMPTLNFFETVLFWGSDGKSMDAGPNQSDSSFYKAYFYTGAGDGGARITYHDGATNSDTWIADSEWIYTIGAGSFGIQHVGNVIEAWYKPTVGSWAQILSTTDSHGTGAGYAAVELDQDSDIIDDFGGGSISCIVPDPPVANFSGTPLTIQVGDSVTFTDLSTNTPTSWSWTFGDSGVSSVQNPVHQYNTAGVYTVALTATNAGGSDGETKVGYVTVIQINDPTLLVATASAYNQIDLRWVDNANNESGFSIERSDNGTTGWAEIDTVAADVVIYSDTTVTAGQTKYYRVRAYKIV